MSDDKLSTPSAHGASAAAASLSRDELHLDEEELSTIEHLAENHYTGRITKFELKELVRVYRSRLNHAAASEGASPEAVTYTPVDLDPYEPTESYTDAHTPPISDTPSEPVAWLITFADGSHALDFTPEEADETIEHAIRAGATKRPLYARPDTPSASRSVNPPDALPEGFVAVPREPTREMHEAARDWSAKKYGKPIGNEASLECYRAMISASPAPSTEDEK
jgi:hypothetical protein